MRHLVVGVHTLKVIRTPCCLLGTVVLLQELPQLSVPATNAIFTVYSSYVFLTVGRVSFGVCCQLSMVTPMDENYRRVLFGHGINLSDKHPRPKNIFLFSFVV